MTMKAWLELEPWYYMEIWDTALLRLFFGIFFSWFFCFCILMISIYIALPAPDWSKLLIWRQKNIKLLSLLTTVHIIVYFYFRWTSFTRDCNFLSIWDQDYYKMPPILRREAADGASCLAYYQRRQCRFLMKIQTSRAALPPSSWKHKSRNQTLEIFCIC